MLGASVSTTNRPTVDLFEYAYNTSRAIPAYNADGSCFFYDYSAGVMDGPNFTIPLIYNCLLYTSPSPRDLSTSRMPSSA